MEQAKTNVGSLNDQQWEAFVGEGKGLLALGGIGQAATMVMDVRCRVFTVFHFYNPSINQSL